MKKSIIFILLFQCCLYGQGKAGAQLLMTTENDFLGINNNDENYTGSLKAELLFPDSGLKFIPFIRYKASQSINIHRIGFGGTAYTPQDLASSTVVVGDRPYASVIFVNIGHTFYDISHSRMFQSELIVGSMGQAAPGKAQAHLHENHWFGSTRPIPNGWHNQIGNGGSFIVNYNTRGQWSIPSDSQWIQPSLVGKIDIGNYMVNLQGGFKLNFFNINSDVLQDYYPNIISVLKNKDYQILRGNSAKKNWRLNLYVEPNLRIVGYNATLEGAMFNDDSVYKISHADVRRLLFEINAGFNITLGDFLYIKYSMFGRSREFEGGKAFHSWGGITLGFSPARWNSK